jgi:hypothetical protein
MDPEVEAAISGAREAWAKYELGDMDGAAERIAQLDAIRTPVTSRYVDLWHQFIAEERAQAGAGNQSNEQTLEEIRRETVGISASGPNLGTRRAWVALVLVGVIGASPTLIEARACIGVEFLLPAKATEVAGNVPPLRDALLYFSDSGAPLVGDEGMTLEQYSSTRADPETHQQLVDDGFLVGWSRTWRTVDGDQIETGVSQFKDAEGALRYHRHVNQYACQFSNEAFVGPGGGIGLQMRYASGPHPIVEQVSWVLGARRYVISVGTAGAPPNHDRLLDLAQRARDAASP